MDLKASFNNVKSEMHGPTCYQFVWYGLILKPYYKKMDFKVIMRFRVTSFLPYSFSPIECNGMRTVRKTHNLISIYNHKYLDNQTGNRLVKVMGFMFALEVYNFDCSMRWIKDIFSECETQLRDPFKNGNWK